MSNSSSTTSRYSGSCNRGSSQSAHSLSPSVQSGSSDSYELSSSDRARIINLDSGRRRQGIWWILTIPFTQCWTPELPEVCQYIRGQRERGGNSGYDHWQVVVAFKVKQSILGVQRCFGRFGHYELSRSTATIEYVWKENTRVAGTQFEFGARPIERNKRTDWEDVWERSKAGELEKIPANIRVVSYRTVRAIASDYAVAKAMVRVVRVFWGCTGSGKSFRAWQEAGQDAYPKDPRSKFWQGYQGEANVTIDEFRGGIDISHLLRWFDCYPVHLETKGSSRPLQASNIWITSNLHPSDWYPDIDHVTQAALMRRFEEVIEFKEPYVGEILSQ